MSVPDSWRYRGPVSEGTRTRLHQAALELFEEQGYRRTTAQGIAVRAGVTERTFFRHFADKGEVLFDDESPLLAALLGALRQAPAEEPLLMVVRRGLHAVAAVLQPERETLRRRSALIAAEPDLQERDLLKAEAWRRAAAALLRQRQVPAREADLATAVGIAAWRSAHDEWLTDRRPTALARRIDRALDTVAQLHRPG